MRYSSSVTLLVLIFILSIFLPVKSFSQIVDTTGKATESSSQMVYFYDEIQADNGIQVTNTNDTESVWIHVQIFRSFNNGTTSVPSNVFCDERNFVDFLTPNDTHVYTFENDMFPKNIGEDEVTKGEETSLVDIEDTKGFVVITPVVSEADLTAISFQYLIGSLQEDGYMRLNAMGRDAVNFATGEVEPVNTPLDGVTNGFVLLQPEELIFNFTGDNQAVDVIGFVFNDSYGPPGLLGYAVTPGSATWTTFIFDFKEDPTSCGIRTVECFLTVGLNDNIGQNNTEFVVTSPSTVEDLLCGGSETPQYDPPSEVDTSNFNSNYEYFGWTRIFVSNISPSGNLLGVFYSDDMEAGRWMNTNK